MNSISKIKSHIRRLVRPRYRDFFRYHDELSRIKNSPRYTVISTRLLGPEMQISDSLSFYYSYKELFEDKIYAFHCERETPIIIDGGSNIGLSVLYFKSLYPLSDIYAFEPDPQIFQILKSNIENFECRRVELINKALWNSETTLYFDSDGADGGRITQWIDSKQKSLLQVKTARLRNYLEGTIDFLKLDVEGAEIDIICDCADKLYNVQTLFVEYHSFAGKKQRFNELINILAESGFRLHVQTKFCPSQPLLKQFELGSEMDLQLNIFGSRH